MYEIMCQTLLFLY